MGLRVDQNVVDDAACIRVGVTIHRFGGTFVVLAVRERRKTNGAAIAHVVTHGMACTIASLVVYRLCRLGVSNFPEGVVFSWKNGR